MGTIGIEKTVRHLFDMFFLICFLNGQLFFFQIKLNKICSAVTRSSQCNDERMGGGVFFIWKKKIYIQGSLKKYFILLYVKKIKSENTNK